MADDCKSTVAKVKEEYVGSALQQRTKCRAFVDFVPPICHPLQYIRLPPS